MNSIYLIAISTIALSLISLVGGLFLLWKKFDLDKWSTHLVGFAAGVMLTTAFIDLIPESIENNTNESIYVFGLLGVVLFFFLERFVVWFHHHHGVQTKPAAYLILLGDSIHNFFDGIAIAAAFLINPSVGFFTTIAIAAHEIPQEIADFSILISGGMSKTKALFYNFLSALTALIGAFLGYFFLNLFTAVTPLLLFFSAGVFIYIACSDLIPDLHEHFKTKRKWATTLPFIIGIAVTYLLITLLGH